MQGQRNLFGSLPEPLHFDYELNSNSSDMDQPVYQSNSLLNPNDMKMEYTDITPQNADVLGVWNSRDANTSAFVANLENRDEAKIDHGWNTAPRMEDGPCERANVTSSNHVHLNLNNTPVDEAQPFPHSLNLTCVSQSVEQNVRSGPHADNAGASLCPFIPNFFEIEHVPCSNSNVNSSNGIERVSEDDVRGKRSVGNRLIGCKRKNMEGVVGESSTSRNISADLSVPNPSMYPPAASSLEEIQSPSFSNIHGGVLPEWYPASSLLRNPETSRRNLHARINHLLQRDVSSSQPHFAVGSNRLSTEHSPGNPASSLLRNPETSRRNVHTRINRLLQRDVSTSQEHVVVGSNRLSTEHSPGEPSSVLNQPHILPVSVLPQHVHHSSSSSSSPASLQRRMRLIAAAHEETSNRSLPINDHPNRNLSISSLRMPGNRDGGSSGVLPVFIREPSEMVPLQYHRNLGEIVRSSLFPAVESEFGHQCSTVPSWHSSYSSSTQEPGHSSRAVHQGHFRPYPRTAASIDSQHGLSSTPLSSRSRDRRSRMISEQIRNALDLMRRGVNLRFEDVFLLDQSRLYGRHGVNDRHRDMRLNVDDMSYEELLALEERIGYVSTGLGEQAILKCLKSQRYSTRELEVASGEQEPCCICQENYSEGEDIGTLDCRHDFHTACIKQWLMIKNLCPICKTTALVEDHSAISVDTK